MNTNRWTELKAKEIKALAEQNATVVVPVGSIEQHGPHLPVQVDARLATEVSNRAAYIVSKEMPVVVAPTVWGGLAEHHMDFGGTITLDFDTFRSVIACVCRSIARHGFSRIMLVNGHGGNIAALQVIVQELAQELRISLAATSYWRLTEASAAFENILETQSNVQHACEAETSMMLAVAPELVDLEAMKTVQGADPSKLGPRDVHRYQSFAAFSESGVIGFPARANAEKGELLLDAAATALASTLMRKDW